MQAIVLFVKKISNAFTGYIRSAARLAVNVKTLGVDFLRWVKTIPGWLKERPKAIKKWWVANKKKRKYHSFKLEKRLDPEPRDIPTSWQLVRQSLRFYKKHFWVFFCIMFIHAFFYALLVYGPTDFDLKGMQESIRLVLGGDTGSVSTTFALFGSLLGAQTQREGAMQFNFIIIFIVSLALVWIIRSMHSNKPFNIRDGFYSGVAPAVPVLIILFIMVLQLLPFTLAAYIYTIGRTNSIFVSGIEDMLFFLITLACGLFSFYLMTPAVLSLYAVTLPNMYPLHTLRLTRKVVQFQRFLLFRRIIALPLMIAVFFGAALLLLLRFYPEGGIWFLHIFPVVTLPLTHIYLFKLYKSVL